jgi:maleylacetoacetate isomerase/maleylpyruvate isomerase
MKLYTYFRSSAAFRVRIALNLKGLAYDAVPVHLLRGGGEQLQPAYRSVNPESLVPCLDDDGALVTQSMAIIEYLDETRPGVPLLPADPLGRARVRALSQMIGCDIHPIDNLRVLRYLVNELGVSEEAKNDWFRHWIRTGFTALEQRLSNEASTGSFCHGDQPTMADCLLVPQVFNARRMDLDLAPFPTIVRIHETCMALPAFDAAQPARQADAE